MQLASTDETLDFLQQEYNKFRAYSDDIKAQIMEFNELVRVPCEKSHLPLRTLYIDLLMHDEMIRSSKLSHDTNRDRISTLMKNKVALQMMIRQRESVYESIVPEPLLEGKDMLTLSEVIVWFPEKFQNDVRKQLEPVWNQWITKQINSQEFIKDIFQKCIVLGCRSVEAFRALFNVLEFVINQTL